MTANVTGACNLSCSYCFYRPRSDKHMTLADFEKLLGILKEIRIFLLTLSGGEPFLHPDIDRILRRAHAEFQHATVLTNGTRITKENLETIEEIIESKGYFPIQVSLDAFDADTNDKTRGMTDTVIGNLESLRNSGASVTVAIVVSSQNIDKVAQTVLSLKHLTRHFHLMPIKSVPYLGGNDQYLSVDQQAMSSAWKELQVIRDEHDILLRTPQDDCYRIETCATGAPCMAGFSQIVIDPNLDVRGCDRCIHSKVGNLKQDSISDIWNGPRLAHVYQREVPYCQVPSEWESYVEASGLARA